MRSAAGEVLEPGETGLMSAVLAGARLAVIKSRHLPDATFGPLLPPRIAP